MYDIDRADSVLWADLNNLMAYPNLVYFVMDGDELRWFGESGSSGWRWRGREVNIRQRAGSDFSVARLSP